MTVDAIILLVGAGGLGCPAGRVLARSGVARLRVADDDVVEGTNLHRQILFDERDLGHPKATVAAERLVELAAEAGHRAHAEPRQERFLPETAETLLEGVDLVVEGSDNFPSKFVVADACALAGIPVVHAGAVRWGGWALSVGAAEVHSTCLRCVFEDVPRGPSLSCELAGVVGPVVGVLGALQARLALERLADPARRATLLSYDGLTGRMRESHPEPRPACPHARGLIRDLQRIEYAPDPTLPSA